MRINSDNACKGMMLGLLMTVHVACASDIACLQKESPPDPALEELLSKVQARTDALTSYECRLEYIYEQPDFESRTERLGKMYYGRREKDSHLRISFESLKQDDQKPQTYIEHFIFDGVWLTHIDFQLKSIQKTQMADPNEPVDALALAGRDIPMIGFTGVEQLLEDFDMKVAPGEETGGKDITSLHLSTKAGSRFENDYRTMVCWFDKKVWLPNRIEATTREGDVYRIRFIGPKINQGIDDSIFYVKIPKGFNQPEIIPLNAQGGQK